MKILINKNKIKKKNSILKAESKCNKNSGNLFQHTATYTQKSQDIHTNMTGICTQADKKNHNTYSRNTSTHTNEITKT